MRTKIENKIKVLQGYADRYNEQMIEELGEAEKACAGMSIERAQEHIDAAKEAEAYVDRYLAQIFLLKQLL